MNRDRLLLKPPVVQSYDVAGKRTTKQTTPEEMSVSKEPPPSKPPSTDAQTSTNKLTVENTPPT